MHDEKSMTFDTISRLPRELAIKSDAVLLRQDIGDDSFKVVLNARPRNTITLNDFSNPDLPSLLSRAKSSVPTNTLTSIILQSEAIREGENSIDNSRNILKLLGHHSSS